MALPRLLWFFTLCKIVEFLIHGGKTIYFISIHKVITLLFVFNMLNARDLSNNKLTGRVPEFLANMKSLLFM